MFDYTSREVLSTADRATLFDSIYETGMWKDNLFGLDCPLSGCGSSAAGSQLAREALGDVVRSFGVRSVAEVGCGDHAWLAAAPLEAMGVTYRGSDISSVVVAQNRAAYPHRSFEVSDGVSSPPPEGELVVFRQVLMHLSEPDNVAVLRRVEASGAKYLLASIHLNGACAEDMDGERWQEAAKVGGLSDGLGGHLLLVGGTKRYLDPPYCLQAPLRIFKDDFTVDQGAADQGDREANAAHARVLATNDQINVPLGMLALWRLDEPGGLFRRGPGCIGPLEGP
jgi:hypothetical protein